MTGSALGRFASVIALVVAATGLAVSAPVASAPAGASPNLFDNAAPATAGGMVPAYWLVASDGGIFSFGGAGFYGSTGGMQLNSPVVAMAGTPDSGGYWEVASDGGIFTFGDAGFFGSTGGMALDKPVVGMAPTADGQGYWLVASDGGIFSFGDAPFYGSMGGRPLNKPIVGMAATPDGGGYWQVASDGGIFAFGDAQFYGSTGSLTLNQPIVGMTVGPQRRRLHARGLRRRDLRLRRHPVLRLAGRVRPDPPHRGHGHRPHRERLLVHRQQRGGVGLRGGRLLRLGPPGPQPAGGGDGRGRRDRPVRRLPLPVGLLRLRRLGLPVRQPAAIPHAIGVVEVDGDGTTFADPNPCLAQEAAWAGGGLNLYDFLYYGTSSSGPAACQGDLACNFGFNQAQSVYGWAVDAGVNTQVTWWLDVEAPTQFWSAQLPENAQVVMGAILGLRAEGINNVGIYASPGMWNKVVGNYQPDVPYWMAWYSGQGGPYNCANAGQWTSTEQLPTGPVVMTQYSSNVNGFDGDYAC